MKKDDQRFKQAHKEAWIGVGLVLFNFLWWYGFAYGLGTRPAKQYHYIFGMPSWFFYSCIAGYIVVTALVIFIVKFFFKDIPFDDEEGDKP